MMLVHGRHLSYKSTFPTALGTDIGCSIFTRHRGSIFRAGTALSTNIAKHFSKEKTGVNG